MIKANELRIGNWISVERQSGGNTKYIQIENIMNGSVNWNDGLNFSYDIDLADGIPLTPELLEACGFSHHDRTVDLGISGYYPTKYWYILDGEEEFRGGTVKQPKYKNGFVIGSYKRDNSFYFASSQHKTKGTELKYLHQLQNLYFALYRQELTVSFPSLSEK